MTRLIIHAGLHKTGSTYLQTALKAGRKPLRAEGIGVIGHARCTGTPWWLRTIGKTGANSLDHAVESFAETLDALRSNGRVPLRTIVLTNERLFGVLADTRSDESGARLYPQATERLGRLLATIKHLPKGTITQVDLFFFFRKQSRFIASAYGQAINEGRDPGAFTEFVKPLNMEDFSWVNLLDRLGKIAEHHPSMTIRAQPYEGWIGPDLLNRFLTEVIDAKGVDPTNWVFTPVANPSLSPRGMELARQVRALCSIEEWRRLRETFQRNFAAQTETDRNWIPPEFIAHCKARFEAENLSLPGVASLPDYY